MRQNIDANTDRLEFGSGLENSAGNAGAMEHQPEGQSADAGADNKNFHGHQPFGDVSTRPGFAAPAKPWRPRPRLLRETVTPARRSQRAKFRRNARRPHHSERF